MSTRSVAAASKHQVLGVAFLALLLLFVWLTYAIFTKKFVSYVPVRLKSSSIGLQLPVLADVKIRGLLVDDLGKLATVSDTYADVVPELANVLRNSVTTGDTFVEKEQKVQALFDDVAGFSRTSKDFLEQNGQNIIRLSRQGQEQLPVFAKYSPEYPCLIKGMVNQAPRLSEQFRGHMLHINLEVLPNSPTGYTPRDSPKNGARNGPHCSMLPHPPYNQQNKAPQPPVHTVDDGVNGSHGKFRPRAATGFDISSGYAGGSAERALLDAMAAPALGVATDDVPDLASLLVGPLARGSEVGMR